MHEELYDLLEFLLGLVTSFDVVESDINVFGGNLVVAAAHSKKGNVEDLSQRDDDGDDDQDGSNLERKKF